MGGTDLKKCRWVAELFTGALKILIRRLWASSVGLSGASYRLKQQHIYTKPTDKDANDYTEKSYRTYKYVISSFYKLNTLSATTEWLVSPTRDSAHTHFFH